MSYSCNAAQCQSYELSSQREWLLTNGIGGFAMGTVSGANSRRYHGHLVAAVAPPAERMVLLANVECYVQGDGNPIGLSCHQYPGVIHPDGYQYLQGFTVDGEAVWRYRAGGTLVEKRLAMARGANAVRIVFSNTGTRPIGLILRPLVSHKPYHGNFRETPGYPAELRFLDGLTVVEHDHLPLKIEHLGAQRVPSPGWYYRFEHGREIERGLDGRDDLFCPCELRYELLSGECAVLTASIGDQLFGDAPPSKVAGTLGDMLRSAADHFLVEGGGRHSIIAGYPWFTDWGRDTMISIPGLCVHTGRIATAKAILRDYASQMRQGLIPNRFVESGEAEYNTADATLWFANAVFCVVEAEWDAVFATEMLVRLREVFRWHTEGTFYGIRVDPRDGLLSQGAPGVQLTWMDAKIGDWVVTPRHGKPIEINALWVNFLRCSESIALRLGEDGDAFAAAAAQAETSFDAAYWRETLGHYLDTADPDDATLRPNQVIAMCLPFSPASGERARLALAKVARELLTPCGLRSLGPAEPGYAGRFAGSMQERDAAYHQGAVWPWLLGPYCTALVKLTGNRAEAKRILKGAKEMLLEYGLGGIAEVYDGDEPRFPGGCPWQAWSVAEILRSWIEDANGK